jgi:hypothetical protein
MQNDNTSRASAPAQSVEDLLDEPFPDAVRFENEGDQVVGTFVRLDHGQNSLGESVPIAVLDVDGERRAVWLFHLSLKSKFKRLAPNPAALVGKTVGIRYTGRRTSQSGRDYADYRVVADLGNVAGDDWDALLGADGDSWESSGDGTQQPF